MRTLIVFFGLLVAPLLAQDQPSLSVTVNSAEAIQSRTTTVAQVLTIGDYTENKIVSEIVGAPVKKPVAVIQVVTPGTAIRVKSKTADVVRLTPTTFAVTQPGRHELDVLALGIIDGELYFEEDTLTVSVGGEVLPEPVDPVDPNPAPGPAPIPVPGFRVLMVYESADITSMSPDQQGILTSRKMRDWLNGNCILELDGTKGWRLYDQDKQFPATCDTVWCKAMSRARNSVPWIVVSNGTTGYEGPLPATVDQTIQLLESYKR